jgi:hypothetical protein
VLGCTQKKRVKIISSTQDSLEVYFSSANNFDLSPKQRENIGKAKIIITQENDSMYRVNLLKLPIATTI